MVAGLMFGLASKSKSPSHFSRGNPAAFTRRIEERRSRSPEQAASFGLEVWTESLHYFRLCHDAERAVALHERLDPSVGVVMDFSHVTASGGNIVDFVAATGTRTRHVHLRDARPGDIHISIGHGVADFAGGFAALRQFGFDGHFALELETRDVKDTERPAAASAAARFVTDLLWATSSSS
jgi:sugar phosphate isomerase/epimerase